MPRRGETLTKLENNREGVGNLYCTVPLFTRAPLGRHGYDAHCFLIQGGIHATENLDIGNLAVGTHGELEGYTALNTVFLGDFGVFEALIDPGAEGVGVASHEGGLGFHQLERNSLFFHHLFSTSST